MKIAIGADHGGFALKEYLKNYYKNQNIDFEDVGTFSEESCDYPLIADKLAELVLQHKAEKGILICGTGIGISIAANRHKGIRAALLYSREAAILSREHNDANVAVFGARTQNRDDVVAYLDCFLQTPFSQGERHCRRIAELG
jgi:ribose 5-phosphate isomerase B